MAAVSISIAFATACLIGTQSRVPRVRLANGTELTLLAVTHGPTNVFIAGGAVGKLLYNFKITKDIKLGPIKIRRVLPIIDNWRKADGTAAFTNRAVVWLGHSGPTNAFPLPVPEEKWFSDIRATLADGNGEEWEMRVGTAIFHPQSSLANPQGGRLPGISHWAFTSFPRRGKNLRLRLYALNDSHAWDTLLDFTIPNPAPGPYPVWISAKLPATQESGDLAISLMQLVTGSKTVPNYLKGGKRPFTKASFEVKEKGLPTGVWHPDRMDATDATGNEPWFPMVTWGKTNGLAYYEVFAASLSPSEVWRLKMRFVKEHREEPEWRSPDLAVETGKIVKTNFATNFQGGRLTVECLQNPFDNTVRCKLNPLPENTKLRLVEFVDNQGRQVEYASGGFEDSGIDAQWKIPTNAESVHFTVGLAETRSFEFFARPGYE